MGETAIIVGLIFIMADVLWTESVLKRRIEEAEKKILTAIKAASANLGEVRDVLTEASRLKSMKEKERVEPSGDTIPSKRTFLSVAQRRSMAAREFEEQRGRTEQRIAANSRAMEG